MSNRPLTYARANRREDVEIVRKMIGSGRETGKSDLRLQRRKQCLVEESLSVTVKMTTDVPLSSLFLFPPCCGCMIW